MKSDAPSCAGQNSAWPIMLPRRSKSTHEKSRPSLKIGENAVRIIVIPISRQTFTYALLRIVSVTGSMVVVLIALSPMRARGQCRARARWRPRARPGRVAYSRLRQLQRSVGGDVEPPAGRDDDGRVHRL